MVLISLRDEVTKALANAWGGFVRRHRRLAAMMDPAMVAEQATESLMENPKLREALETAGRRGTSRDAVVEIIARFVGCWLEGLQ